VPALSPVNYADALVDRGYRHGIDMFLNVEHLLIALTDSWDRGAEYLAESRRTDDPARVTYRHVPDYAHPDLDLVHDGAYWVSDVAAREDADDAFVDAISLADGYGEPVAEEFTTSGSRPEPHSRRGVRWEDPTDERGPANALELSLDGVAEVTVWVEEAGLDADRELTLNVETDGPATVTLAGRFGRHEFDVEAGESPVTLSPLT